MQPVETIIASSVGPQVVICLPWPQFRIRRLGAHLKGARQPLRSSRTTKALVSLSIAVGYHPTICCSEITGWGLRTVIGIGFGLASIALAVNPVGLRFATGRLYLNLPIELVSLTLAVFLLIWSGAFVSYGRARRAFFYLIVFELSISIAGRR